MLGSRYGLAWHTTVTRVPPRDSILCAVHIKTNWWHPLIGFAIAEGNSVAEFSFVIPADKCVPCILPRTVHTTQHTHTQNIHIIFGSVGNRLSSKNIFVAKYKKSIDKQLHQQRHNNIWENKVRSDYKRWDALTTNVKKESAAEDGQEDTRCDSNQSLNSNKNHKTNISIECVWVRAIHFMVIFLHIVLAVVKTVNARVYCQYRRNCGCGLPGSPVW